MAELCKTTTKTEKRIVRKEKKSTYYKNDSQFRFHFTNMCFLNDLMMYNVDV